MLSNNLVGYRWNMLHILTAYFDPSVKLYLHVLKKLPEETLKTLMSQQSRGRRNTVSPFSSSPCSVIIKIYTATFHRCQKW